MARTSTRNTTTPEIKTISKTIRIKANRNIISSYGDFEEFKEYEVSEKVAEKLIKAGVAEKC